MSLSIESIKRRFDQIVRGKVRGDLKKLIGRGEMIGRRGGRLISIPVPQVVHPHFVFGNSGKSGAGAGEGKVGSPLGPAGKQPGAGAGDEPGGHILEVDVTLEELARMLGDELGLPPPDRKGQHDIEEKKDRYTSVRRTGPEGLLFRKRSTTKALVRVMSGVPLEELRGERFSLEPYLSLIYPVRPDKKYRSWKTYPIKVANAVVIYMMDVSGSMTDEQKNIVRQTCFWLDLWICYEYKGVGSRYIVHDSEAAEVDRETFYHTRESGGTKISSAYHLADLMTDGTGRYESKKFGRGINPNETSIYFFHFSDGDNWGEDNARALEIIKERLLPRGKLFAYFQVESPYGKGDFIRTLGKISHPHLATTTIADAEGIYDALKEALPKERRG